MINGPLPAPLGVVGCQFDKTWYKLADHTSHPQIGPALPCIEPIAEPATTEEFYINLILAVLCFHGLVRPCGKYPQWPWDYIPPAEEWGEIWPPYPEYVGGGNGPE